MIFVENKKRKIERIQKQHPGAYILDLTSSSTAYAQKLSPFYPHGGIPIPFSEGEYAMSVEGIWQGLKVFESCDIDYASFSNSTMKGLKRTVRKYGKPLGHRKGTHGAELLSYYEARMLIYLPSYKYILERIAEVHNIVQRIKEQSKISDIVFLDYATNIDVRDTSSPLSHAGLVKLYIEDCYPSYDPLVKEYSIDELQSRRSTKKSKKGQLTLF